MKKHLYLYSLLAMLILAGAGLFYSLSGRVWGTQLKRLDNLVLYDPHTKTTHNFSNQDSQQAFIKLNKSKTASQQYRQSEPTAVRQELVLSDEPVSAVAYGGDYGGELQLYEKGGVTMAFPIPANHYAQIYLKTEYAVTSSQIEEKKDGKWVIIGQVESRQELASYNEAVTWSEEEWEEQYPTDSNNN